MHNPPHRLQKSRRSKARHVSEHVVWIAPAPTPPRRGVGVSGAYTYVRCALAWHDERACVQLRFSRFPRAPAIDRSVRERRTVTACHSAISPVANVRTRVGADGRPARCMGPRPPPRGRHPSRAGAAASTHRTLHLTCCRYRNRWRQALVRAVQSVRRSIEPISRELYPSYPTHDGL